MYIINDTNLKFAWESDELIEKMMLETSYASTFVDSKDGLSNKYIFTEDETPFFEQHIVSVMTDVVDIFQKFILIDFNSFFIDEEKDSEWDVSSNVSGFSSRDNEFDDTSYNTIRLNIIDERVREYILKSLLVQWYKTTGDLARFKQSSEDKASAYIGMFCALKYLKENGAYYKNNVTLS
ncbi:MAG: hypothetical protein R3Y51_06065 [Rikenellaceae bacterium]